MYHVVALWIMMAIVNLQLFYMSRRIGDLEEKIKRLKRRLRNAESNAKKK